MGGPNDLDKEYAYARDGLTAAAAVTEATVAAGKFADFFFWDLSIVMCAGNQALMYCMYAKAGLSIFVSVSI